MHQQITLVLDNIRSAQNVGSLMRSADAFGVARVICVGITPFPQQNDDSRLPHIAQKATRDIAKTALGAEQTLAIAHYDNLEEAVAFLGKHDIAVYALEQSADSIPLQTFTPKFPCALILGNEVTGIALDKFKLCDAVVEIPMLGRKESLNVAVTGGVALYALTSLVDTAR